MSIFIPEDIGATCWAGYVRVGNDEYKVRVSGVQYKQALGEDRRMDFSHSQVLAEPPLALILARHKEILKIRLQQSSTITQFVQSLQELIAVCAPSTHATTAVPSAVATATLPSAEYYTRLISELDVVGWHRLLHLSPDLRTVELHTHDTAERRHIIRITLPIEYAHTLPTCNVDAPQVFTPQGPVTLALLVEQFDGFLQQFQTLWSVLDDVDQTCCVLEPQHPTRATTRRRIAIQPHVSIQFHVDVDHPLSMPTDVRFFGNEATIAALRERWNDSAFNQVWDEAHTLVENLETVLDVELPRRKTTSIDTFALECGICYCYRLDTTPTEVEEGMIPDRLCENEKCNRPFHETCLFEWLKSLPTTRQSFNTVFGECPYCREAISAKFRTIS